MQEYQGSRLNWETKQTLWNDKYLLIATKKICGNVHEIMKLNLFSRGVYFFKDSIATFFQKWHRADPIST